MDSVLEQQRKFHEERERLLDSITRETMIEKKSHKAAINSQHRIKNMAERYFKATSQLESLYNDLRGERDKELDSISGPNEFAEFYSRLKSLKDQHKRNPDEPAQCLSIDFQEINADIANPEREEPDVVMFTDEEGYGRFLDLHLSFDKYLNLKGVKRIDYIAYLQVFDKFHEISKNVTKKTGAYREYLQHLKDYLVGFINRTRPMMDVLDEMDKASSDVERLWEQGGVPGWSDQKAQGAMAAGPAAVPLDLSGVTSASELEGFGLERLKSALQALGLKCGGTLKERSERLFATKGHKLSDLEKAALARKEGNDKEGVRNKQLAVLEMQIKTLVNILLEEREATKENVERKQARAGAELSDEEEDVQIESDDEEDDSVPYNPKNLPLGWDGKPIPYWLYKLHGLNITYSCEICGNQTYKGPKAFQRHFSEWRHSHSMRCLGIPNTAHFMNITKIAEALALWNKIKKEKETQKWNPEMDEEYEDSAGNVVNRRTYEDLKRQGLL